MTHVVSLNMISIGSGNMGNVSLPRDMILPKTMLTDHRWSQVAFTWGQIY